MYGLDSWWASSQVFQYHDTRTFAEGFRLLKTLKCIAIYWSLVHDVSLRTIASCKGLRIPESGKFFAGGNRNPRKFSLWNPESWALEFGIQLKESGIPQKMWNPEYNFLWHRLKSSIWNPEFKAWNPESKTILTFFTWGENYKRFSQALYNYLCFGPVHVDTEFLSCQSIVHRQHHFFKCMPVIPLPVKIYARIERRIGKSK